MLSWTRTLVLAAAALLLSSAGAGSARAVSLAIVDVQISNIQIITPIIAEFGPFLSESWADIPGGAFPDDQDSVPSFTGTTNAQVVTSFGNAQGRTGPGEPRINTQATTSSNGDFATWRTSLSAQSKVFKEFVKGATSNQVTVSFDYRIYRALVSEAQPNDVATSAGFLQIILNPDVSGTTDFRETLPLTMDSAGGDVVGFETGTLSLTVNAPGVVSPQVQVLASVIAQATSPFNSPGAVVPPGAAGAQPSNPILPDSAAATIFNFGLDVGAVGTVAPIFIDPDPAIAYDYAVGDGQPGFTSVLLPLGIGDDVYELLMPDGMGGFMSLGMVNGGEVFTFSGPKSAFRVAGIEPGAGLDPEDPTAFVTGLTFASAGQVDVQMQALSSIPEPGSTVVLLLGFAGLAWTRRRA